jgi:hypothetical protein
LALLLVGALLLCHGVYGVSHQIFATQHAEQPHHSHAPQADHTDTHGAGGGGEHSTEGQGGDPGGHLGHVVYAAALLAISLGAVVLWPLSGTRTWTRNVLPSLPEHLFRPVFLLRPMRSPDLPLLQVFRL